MPEYPDVQIYLERLDALLTGHTLLGIRNRSPFLLRTVDPPLGAVAGTRVLGFQRLGKRLVWNLEDDVHLVLHLMIAGRIRWKKVGTKVPPRNGLAAFDFEHGTLILTEASKKKRASLHVVRGSEGLEPFERGGLSVFDATAEAFTERLRSENHTLKRALTDPRLFDGVGNAYSDEILFEARLSPVKLTSRLTDDEAHRLWEVSRACLSRWTTRFREEIGEGFPDKVTAFRPDMFVHGRYREPCRVCEAPIQRILYADRETNYCAPCQNGGRLLADRALSQLLKKDWPRTLTELEERLGRSP